MQDEAEERRVDLEIAVVFEEPQVSELVQEEIDARTCRADHFGKGFLGDLRYPLLRSLLITIPRQQQQCPRHRFSLELKR